MSKKNIDIDFDDLDLFEEEEKGFDIQTAIVLVRANWKKALISAAIALMLAFVYIRYATPVYQTGAKILVKDDQKAARGEIEMLQALGILPGTSNVNNELEIIQSYSLMDQVVNMLGLNITLYTTDHTIKQREIYVNSLPFSVRQEITDRRLYTGLTGKIFLLTQQGDTITLDEQRGDARYTGVIGGKIELPGLTLYLTPGEGTTPLETPYELGFRSLQGTVNAYNAAVDAFLPNKQTSVIDLEVQNSIPRRSEDLLNMLIHQYIRNGIDDRNAVSDSTIAFINIRLANVEIDLSLLEGEIQEFKQRNEIVNITEQASALIGNVSGLSQSEANLEVQLSVVNSLLAFLEQTGQDPKVIAASLMVDNAGLTALIERYNALLLERERNLLSITPDNPIITNLDTQLGTLRNNIRNGLGSQKQSLQASLSSIRRRTGTIESSMRTVPGKERQAIEYNRQQQIKQELYLFLLQKREEAALSKSSTVSNVRIIDTARTTRPVKPRKRLIYFAALLLGAGAPFVWLFLTNMVNVRVRSRKEITTLTETPIVGEIGHYDGEDTDPFVIGATSGTPLSEQFRILRTNLRFALGGKERNVILVTSSIPNEGKTFVSMNLSAGIALSGKRTLLVGMDLRKPQIAQRLHLDRKSGVSDVLIGAVTLDEALIPVEGYDNKLFVLSAGTIPPNPAELLMSPATQQLFDVLKKRFECIVIDSAPLVVTDASILSEHADSVLLVTRINYTYKESVKQIEQFRREKRMPNLGIVVNDIDMEQNGYSYYGYGYGYGSYRHYSYYHNDEEKSKKRKKK